MFRFPARRPALSLAGLAACSAAVAQGVATDAELAPVIGSGRRGSLPAHLVSTTAGKTADDLREQNLFNPEDALQYAPNTTLRKRYVGDRNALMA